MDGAREVLVKERVDYLQSPIYPQTSPDVLRITSFTPSVSKMNRCVVEYYFKAGFGTSPHTYVGLILRAGAPGGGEIGCFAQ